MNGPTMTKSFLRDDRGTMTIFSVFILMLILIVTGAAVDIMRHESVRASMQATLDHAVLAAADLDQQRPPETVVADYLTKAGMGSTLADVRVTESMTHRTVMARSQTTLDTFFLRMSGFEQLNAHALSEAEENISYVEVSLVLDISGSMRWNTRMDRLKPAAGSFVETVLARDPNTTSINLIPYAGQVNPGPDVFDWLEAEPPTADADSTPPDATDYTPMWSQDISNIVVYFDTDDDGFHDRAHKIEGFPETGDPDFISNDVDHYLGAVWAHAVQIDDDLTWDDTLLGVSIKGGKSLTAFYAVEGNANGPAIDYGPAENTANGQDSEVNWGTLDIGALEAAYVAAKGGTGAVAVSIPSSCVEIPAAAFGETALPPEGTAQVPHFHYWPIDNTVMDWGWCPEDDTAIQYLANNATQLSNDIKNLRMHDGTGTHYGMKWAVSLLSPEARWLTDHLVELGLAPEAHYGLPRAWGAEGTQKFIVLMTDGQITDQWRPVDPTHLDNAIVELKDQSSDNRVKMTRRDDNLSAFYDQCDLAKANGVVVFTIAFEAPQGGRDEMRTCASSASHFFDVEGNEINEAFQTIARQINNLRLTQ